MIAFKHFLHPVSLLILPKCLNTHNNIDTFLFSFEGSWIWDQKCILAHSEAKICLLFKIPFKLLILHLFSPLNFQWNSQVLNEFLPNRTHKVTPPPVPTPSILSAAYQLCQAFNLPGDIPVFPAWDRGKDKHASPCRKSLRTPTHSLIWPLFN